MQSNSCSNFILADRSSSQALSLFDLVGILIVVFKRYMTASSDDEYELLPTNGEFKPDISMRKHGRGGCTRSLLRFLKRRPIIICFVFVAFSLAFAFLVYEVQDLKRRLAIAESIGTYADRLWPVGLPNRTDIWENENSKAMHALTSCINADSCRENQTSIVMLSSFHFANAIAGHVSGEDIWAASVLDAVHDLGYTPIFTTNNEQMALTYRQYPDLVKIIIVEGYEAESCFNDKKCIKSVEHPLGVPAWKMFSFHYWGGVSHPLGNSWTLSPENYAIIAPWSHSENNIYLGYSIERTCMKNAFIPNEERPMQAYVLAKQSRYFFEDYAWPGILQAPFPMDMSLIVGIGWNNAPNDETIPTGITDIGGLNKTMFYHHLSRSRALIGLGWPKLSPSPYDALCMGVPFINPVMEWDSEDPESRSKWGAQHDGLKFLDPPYVYNVKKGDGPGFWNALRAALDTPIERYIKPEMTMDALKSRISKLIEGPWREKAEILLEERQTTGEGQLFEL